MNGILGVSAFLLTAFVSAVAIFDLRERRIPNFLVFPAVVAGVILNTYRLRLGGLGLALLGLAVGFALLILPYAVGGMKAGDVKFLSAIGSFVGAADVVRVLLAALLCYPAFAAVVVIRERKMRVTWLRFRRVLFNFLGFFLPGMKLYAMKLEGQDDPGISSAATPFGVSIAAGTLIAIYTDFLR
ncbi:MAG: A24 family peptidase [Blastocatellia bacterium]